MISIIVPVYNAEKYLCRCVDSVLSQSVKEIELILIDDGSKDGSATLCKQYAERDDRVVYIRQENQGAGAARHRGVLEAKGEYIFFIDSDDYLELDALSLLMSEFTEDMDCVVGQHERFGEIENIKQVRFPVGTIHVEDNKEQVLIWETIESYYGQELWNKLYRAELVKKAFAVRNITVPYGEDSLYLIELYVRMRGIKCISNLTYHYEFRADSLARRTQNLKILEDFARECILLKNTLIGFSLQETIPLVFLHVLNIALTKYRGLQGVELLIQDFHCLQDETQFVDCAKAFLKNKKYLRKKYGLDRVHYYQAIGLYKAILKRDIWYYVKWYPLMADDSVSMMRRIKAYINKLLGRVSYERG